MDVLRDLITLVNHIPKGGEMLRLYRLVYDTELNREQVRAKYSNDARFRQAYKKLKDKYLQELLVKNFDDAKDYNRRHIVLYKKYAQTKILLQAAKRRAAMSIAVEVLTAAKMLGLLEVASDMADELMCHYAVIEPNRRKFNIYERQVLKFTSALFDQRRANAVLNRFSLDLKMGGSDKKMRSRLEELKELCKTNSHYRFRLYYYTACHLYRRDKKDRIGVVNVCEEAIDFFEDCDTRLPYVVKWSFYFYLVPELIKQKRYLVAKDRLGMCFGLVRVGSFNYHMTLILQAVNFICLEDLKGAQSVLDKAGEQWLFKSDDVVNYWVMVQDVLIGGVGEVAGQGLLYDLYG